jgi:glycosyltransferase involved in cell wall biosynthesis
MRVVIALTSASREVSGVQRHAMNLARCLLTRNEFSEVHLVAAPWQEKLVRSCMAFSDGRLSLHTPPLSNSAWSRNLWYGMQLPRITARLRPNVIHLAYPVPVRHGAFDCPVVVTLHDLYPYDVPENFGFPKVFFNQLVLRQSLHAVDAIACVSHSTLKGLRMLAPHLASTKAVVIPNCVEPYSSIAALSPLPQWNGEPFFLCVAQHRRNKNLLFLLRVFNLLLQHRRIAQETRLVIVGIPGPETTGMYHFLHAKGIGDRVVLLHGISEDALQWCYRHCALLLAPSLVEGFGLPIAEGLLAGCRILCSDIAAFRELGGDHCTYVTLENSGPEVFADAVLSALRDPVRQPVALPELLPTQLAKTYFQLYSSLQGIPDKRDFKTRE